MLDPQDRRLFLEALRPPPAYELDYAVGTTFSLDLMALLIAPLEFTVLSWKDDDGQPTSDPVALLEALRRNSDRIAVFCQAGAIAVPRRQQLLFSFLEQSVFQLMPKRSGGVFHPKVWILRFASAEQTVLYRLLVATRNLTFDRSWDTLLVLDGELTARQKGPSVNRPLAEFIGSLQGMARKLPEQWISRLHQLERELRMVAFDWPGWTESGTFHRLDEASGSELPYFAPCSRSLTMSPFLAESALKQLTDSGGKHALISRLESLQKISPDVLGAFEKIWVLDEQAHGEPDDDLAVSDGSLPPADSRFENRGLHAKTYVRENGWDASIYTGSANATQAGISQNVEFMVGLHGKRSTCGVDAVLGHAGQVMGLKSILKEYQPAETEVDDLQERVDQAAERARYALAGAGLRLTIESAVGDDRFDLDLSGDLRALREGITVECWPISLRQDQSALHLQAEGCRFPGLSLPALTSFVAFEVTAKEGAASSVVRFVLNLPMEGAPENRLSLIMSELLKDKSSVIRLILLLLAGEEAEAREALLQTGSLGSRSWSSGLIDLPLLEPMVKALHASPARLDHVARLVEDLHRSAEGASLLPDGFDTVWEPIWQARQAIGNDASAT